MNTKAAWVALVLQLALAVSSRAQEPPTSDHHLAATAGAASAQATSPEGAARPRPWSVYLTAGNVFDSNIEHERRGQESLGVVFGAGVQYRNDATRPTIQLAYEAAGHAYSQTNRWNRLSQHLEASFRRSLSRAWALNLAGVVSLKGSSEDRELTNQYMVVPTLEYRHDGGTRVRVYGTRRLKRYDDDRDREATNTYGGIEVRRRFRSGVRWDVGYRFETNHARSLRHRFGRRTYSLEYARPLTANDALAVELRYRSQRYPHRRVEIQDGEVSRHDRRWIPDVTWGHRITSDVDLRVRYGFEARSSNDRDRAFRAHSSSVTLACRW